LLVFVVVFAFHTRPTYKTKFTQVEGLRLGENKNKCDSS